MLSIWHETGDQGVARDDHPATQRDLERLGAMVTATGKRENMNTFWHTECGGGLERLVKENCP